MISAMGTPEGKEQGTVVLDPFNNKDGQSHDSKNIINAEKQKVRPHLRILPTGSRVKTNLGD